MKFEQLGDIISIQKGRKCNIVNNPSNTSERLIQIGDLRNDNEIIYTDNKNGVFVSEDDLLIAWDGANAGTVGFGKRGYIGSTIAAMKKVLPNKYYTPYLGRFLQTQFKYLQKAATGATIPHINRKSLEQLRVPIPNSFSDQVKISVVLNKAEVLIRQRKESIQLLDEFLKSMFLRMFGDPIRNDKKWAVDSLSKFGVFKNGLNFSKDETGFSFSCLGVGDFKNLSKLTDMSSLSIINVSTPPSNDYFLRDGDLVFVRSNGNKELVGRSIAVFPKDQKVTFSGFCIRFRLIDEKLNLTYLNHLLRNSAFRNTMLQNGRGANIQNINQETLGALKIPLPSLSIQNQFAAIVEKVEIIKAQFQNSLSDLENLHASLSQRAFKGELDLSAVTIDESLLEETTKLEPVALLPFDVQEAVKLANKITHQYDKINAAGKITAHFTKQLEQWSRLEDQFEKAPMLPDTLLQAQKRIARMHETIYKTRTKNTDTDEGFNWATLADSIKTRYKDLYFNFEMLINFIQKNKLSESVQYYASEELKANPRLNDAEDLKTFIQSAVQNVEMDEKQQRQTNPFLQLTQSFYNAEEENFSLSLHKDDFNLIKNKETRMRSGIYFRITTTEA